MNLYITNVGFGEPMVQYGEGALRNYGCLSGKLLGKVSFYLEGGDVLSSPGRGNVTPGTVPGFGNDAARERVGRRTVFSWPFPEAATVPRHLGSGVFKGNSSAAMGTAPDVWNDMLGVLVRVVPRPWWRSERFSRFLADFSQPLVRATDALLRLSSPDGMGETHAMRVDVTSEDGGLAFSTVQAHESFRRCVGQSCAEFALDLLDHPSPGVRTPEGRYGGIYDLDDDDELAKCARGRIVARLTTTPGTFAYTGPVRVRSAPAPTDLESALREAESEEDRLSRP